jgi:hypothetical protein
MKHTEIDLSDSIGEPKPEPKKQRTRKPRKQNQKELLNEYYTEVEKERDNSVAKQRKLYENMQYLSGLISRRSVMVFPILCFSNLPTLGYLDQSLFRKRLYDLLPPL